MTYAKSLTSKELTTIRSALSYAVAKRLSYLDAIVGCGMKEEKDRAKSLVEKIEKLNEKLFGEPTHHKRLQDEIDTLPSVSINDLRGD